MIIDKQFEKETFKKSVRDNVRFLFRKTLEEATPQQIFQAVSYSVKDVIIDNWLLTQKTYEEQDPKTVYYMSMEFLMGRALGNNLLNLTAYKEVKEALDELGINLSWSTTLASSPLGASCANSASTSFPSSLTVSYTQLSRPVPWMRYGVLALLAACCVRGLAGLSLNWLDPYSIFGRIMYVLAWPAAI